jgi:hypothetical protein
LHTRSFAVPTSTELREQNFVNATLR